jgi:hypothetical protein
MGFGFKNAEGKKPMFFEGHADPYIELVKDITPPENAICASTDSVVLFRTEGYWTPLPNSKPPPYEGGGRRRARQPRWGTIVDFFRDNLKQTVSIHRAQFEKLLFEEDSDVGPELAELFRDAGKTYLLIAERISARCESRQAAED